MAKTNSEMLQAFISEVKAGPSTKTDYVAKLAKLSKQVTFADPEGQLVDFLKTVENPNTRTNEAFSLIRLRRHFNLPVALLEGLREEIKARSACTARRKPRPTWSRWLVTTSCWPSWTN